jgi:hypothetical protein
VDVWAGFAITLGRRGGRARRSRDGSRKNGRAKTRKRDWAKPGGGIAEGWKHWRGDGKGGARLSEWATRGSISWERLLGRISPLGVAWGRLAFAFVAKLHSTRTSLKARTTYTSAVLSLSRNHSHTAELAPSPAFATYTRATTGIKTCEANIGVEDGVHRNDTIEP